MKRALFPPFFIIFFLLLNTTAARDIKPDTVRIGIYVTSIHDIDFKQKEYTMTFWLWLKYKNKKFDFSKNLEIPPAKSFSTSYFTVDSSDERIYMMMKIQAIMKDSWRIGNFPFDRQMLRLTIENSQYDLRYLIFEADTIGEHYDKRFAISGWGIDSFNILTGTRVYETAFGDETIKPRTEYSAYRVRISINRNATGMFWKMFLGMYIAFLIAYVCFFIHADGMDSRFGLSVGSLFAVIGNKYIIDSALPESTSFTLVDTLHGLTLFFIFAVITATAFSLKLVKRNKVKVAYRFDMITAQLLMLIYIILNVFFIWNASKGS